MQKKITAVVFDMDGVLFDTERMYMECWREAAEPKGLKNVDEISKACIGRTLQGTKEVFDAAKAEQGIDVPFEEIHEDCSRRFKEKAEQEGIPEKPGVHEILEYLKQNRIPVALASSTRKTAVMEHLDRAGITAYFQKIVCGDMVEHGKPAPDIYLKACEELGVAPGQAMAVEDSFNGIRAAHAAGLYTVMVPDQLPPTQEILAIVDKKCDSLMELQEKLPEILKVSSEENGDSGIEITWEQVQALAPDSYILVDTRGDEAVNYGKIPEAVAISECELADKLPVAAGDKKVVLYCSRGQNSKVSAEYFREQGLDAYSLQGGYTGWLLNLMQKEQPGEKENERAREIEKSIRKKFHKVLFSRFAKAINEYDMIQENDKIAVCISGGKDSMLMAKLFQELKRHNKFPFELVFLVMDPGYSEANRKIIENNAKLMDIPITVFESRIFDAVYDIEDSPCYLCARMRRGYLYSHAKELGCNKIALGHHYDDVIETILMGMLYGGQVQTMMPKLHSTNFEGMELIRPMYLIREDDIKRWRDYNDLHFIQCACRFTDTCTTCRTDGSSPSKRMEIKNLIASLKQTNPFIEGNIFKSVENVNLRTIIAYKEDGVKHHFLEHYDEWK